MCIWDCNWGSSTIGHPSHCVHNLLCRLKNSLRSVPPSSAVRASAVINSQTQEYRYTVTQPADSLLLPLEMPESDEAGAAEPSCASAVANYGCYLTHLSRPPISWMT